MIAIDEGGRGVYPRMAELLLLHHVAEEIFHLRNPQPLSRWTDSIKLQVRTPGVLESESLEAQFIL